MVKTFQPDSFLLNVQSVGNIFANPESESSTAWTALKKTFCVILLLHLTLGKSLSFGFYFQVFCGVSFIQKCCFLCVFVSRSRACFFFDFLETMSLECFLCLRLTSGSGSYDFRRTWHKVTHAFLRSRRIASEPKVKIFKKLLLLYRLWSSFNFLGLFTFKSRPAKAARFGISAIQSDAMSIA